MQLGLARELIVCALLGAWSVHAAEGNMSRPNSSSATTMGSSTKIGSASSAGTSSTTLEGMKPPKTFEADKRVTDLELRAAAGSMSRWSVKAELGYTGPAVNALHDYNRPNPNGSTGDFRTFMSGALGVRYRMSEQNTLSFGTGVTWYTPLQTMTGQEVKKAQGAADDFSTSNPRVSFDHSYVVGPFQMRDNIRFQWVTDSYYMKTAQVASIGFSHNMKYVVDQTRLTLGLELTPSFYVYNREWIPKDRRTSNYFVGLYPNFSYRLLSRLDVMGSLGYSYNNLRREGSWWLWTSNLISGRMGLGWSVTPEVYINPYVNFFTQRPSLETTTVAIGTVFSIF